MHGAGDLTVRATLTISPNWKAADNAPLGALVEGWAGWLAEPGLGDDWLKMSGLFALVGRSPADNVRGAAAPYTGWAGFNSDAGLPRDQLRQVLLNCAANNIRVAAITGTAGLSTYLDLYEEVHRQISLRGRRWVLAHIAVISPREIERIARMDLVLTTRRDRRSIADRTTRRHRAFKRSARSGSYSVACNRQRADFALGARPTDDRAPGFQIATYGRSQAGTQPH